VSSKSTLFLSQTSPLAIRKFAPGLYFMNQISSYGFPPDAFSQRPLCIPGRTGSPSCRRKTKEEELPTRSGPIRRWNLRESRFTAPSENTDSPPPPLPARTVVSLLQQGSRQKVSALREPGSANQGGTECPSPARPNPNYLCRKNIRSTREGWDASAPWKIILKEIPICISDRKVTHVRSGRTQERKRRASKPSL